MFTEAFFPPEKNIVILCLSHQQIFKIKLISNCLKYNCWVPSLFYIFDMFSSGNLHCLSFVFAAFRLQESFLVFFVFCFCFLPTISFISLGFYPNQSFKNQVTQIWGVGLGNRTSLLLTMDSNRKERGVRRGGQSKTAAAVLRAATPQSPKPACSSPSPW